MGVCSIKDRIRYILSQEGHFSLNYCDDHLILGKATDCKRGFHRLKELLPERGLTISDHKTIEQSTDRGQLFRYFGQYFTVYCFHTTRKIGEN